MEVRDLLASDDTDRMLEALQTLGVAISPLGGNAWRVGGVGGHFPNREAQLFSAMPGPPFRSLTAVLALAGGCYQLSGVPRMHERPIGDLVDALRQLGADITCLENEGYPPLEIRPAVICSNEVVHVRGDVSSQFLTGLLSSLAIDRG